MVDGGEANTSALLFYSSIRKYVFAREFMEQFSTSSAHPRLAFLPRNWHRQQICTRECKACRWLRVEKSARWLGGANPTHSLPCKSGFWLKNNNILIRGREKIKKIVNCMTTFATTVLNINRIKEILPFPSNNNFSLHFSFPMAFAYLTGLLSRGLFRELNGEAMRVYSHTVDYVLLIM